MTKKYFVFHGHFYQPPREDPWLNEIELQPSAAPFHDWNARIDAECYAVNARARILGLNGIIEKLVDNYEYMSFNFGPTLLSWMAKHAPATLIGIQEGDRLSAERLGGHGNAIGQVYNHMIMPLASARDKRTQVKWGKEVFRHYFKRDPEGMHLAETAVSTDSLEALAEAGVKFTVLAPRQAKRWRKIGDENWQEGGVDPSRAYRCNLPSGKSITLFFYDGPISQAVAFEKLLNSGEGFVNRIMSGYDEHRDHDQLMHLAVDGETVGHHHKFGEMCVAWMFNKLVNDSDVTVTNYGQFLELNPPTWEVEIHENSSWSCVHGVERWKSDCGCNTGGTGWHQRWRAPLRQALDTLRAKLDTIFEREGGKYFTDPWSARDAYIEVLLDESKGNAFVRQHCTQGLSNNEIRRALELLEMERFGMLMYTSCAWFFDELSGIEPTQNLRYAARAIELARLFTDEDLERALVSELEKAESNLPKFGNGKVVWEQVIRPGVTLREAQALLSGSLASVQELSRTRALIDEAFKLGLDRKDAQDRVVNAYARLSLAGLVTPELHSAYVSLASHLGITEAVLGWNHAGIVDYDSLAPKGCEHDAVPEAFPIRRHERWRI